MQGLTLAAITASEKHTLMLDPTQIMLDDIESQQSHSSMKSGSRVLGHSAFSRVY